MRNMKFYCVCLLTTISFFFTSCTTEDEPLPKLKTQKVDDTTKPLIFISGIKGGDKFEVGETVNVNLNFSDNVELSSWKTEIKSVKASEKIWKTILDSFSGNISGKEVKVEKTFIVPDNAEPGIYQFIFHVTDKAGNQNENILDIKILEKGRFEIILKSPNHTIEPNTVSEIEYDFTPTIEEQTDYELKFEVGSVNGTDSSALLNGTQAGKWFNISGHKGKLYYIPSAGGSNTVYITAKNKLGVERKSSFTVALPRYPLITSYKTNKCPLVKVVNGQTGAFVQYSCSSAVQKPPISIIVHSGGDDLEVKSVQGLVRVNGEIVHSPYLEKSWKDNRYFDLLFRLKQAPPPNAVIDVKFVIANSAGFKTEYILPIEYFWLGKP